MSQVISVFGFFGVLAAAYGCDRLILFLRMKMAATFDPGLYYPLILLVGLLMACVLLAYTLFVFVWNRKDTAMGVLVMVFSIGVLIYAVLSIFIRTRFTIMPGSYLSFIAAFTSMMGLAMLILPDKCFGGKR
jgi:hypothetical protein